MAADPLGLIGGGGVMRPGMPVSGGAGPAPDPSAPSFKDVLLDNLNEVNKAQREADRAVEDMVSGKRHDFDRVIDATAKADTAFKMLQALRNRVVEAYDEIKQIRV